MIRTRLLPFAFLVPAVVLVGCSSGNKLVPARVSGSVSYNGQPIKAGRMAFHAPDKTSYDAIISTDGTYTATDLPEADMIVTVETEHLKEAAKPKNKTEQRRMGAMQQAAPGAETPIQHYMKIPAKYAKVETSPLKATLTRGNQTKNFELTD